MIALIGFARGALQATDVPPEIDAVALGDVTALLTAHHGPEQLPDISAKLLRLQSVTAIIPLRPAAPPPDLAAHVARSLPAFIAAFDQVGTCVEFIVTIKLPPLSLAEPAAGGADYLRATHRARQAAGAALSSARAALASATAVLDQSALAAICGERNVKDFAAIHYLMDRQTVSAVIAQWQMARAHLSVNAHGADATLAGPWAPYSFVSIEP